MENKNTLFVTCFYSGLDGTVLGGRSSRFHHYTLSLQTLLNMETDFVVYTSQQESEYLNDRFKNFIENGQLRVIVYDLFSHPQHLYFQEKMNGHKTDRCYEVMFSKTSWVKNHISEDYEYIYWIDCGLCHGGLFPSKYRQGETWENFYTCTLFNNQMVKNLNNLSDKVMILYGDQKYHGIEGKACHKFYENISSVENCHIVGGMFGGKKDVTENFCDEFSNIIIEMMEYGCLEYEERLYTVIYQRNKENFHKLPFTTWYYDESEDAKSRMPEGEIEFYKIFENLNS